LTGLPLARAAPNVAAEDPGTYGTKFCSRGAGNQH
jgi:hypothetical protein